MLDCQTSSTKAIRGKKLLQSNKSYIIFAMLNQNYNSLMDNNKKNFTEGPEIHRLKPLNFSSKEEEQFERLYREARGYIRKLARNINCKKYRVSPDILVSYFEDKLLYVWDKYKDEYPDYNHLKSIVFKSLGVFKNKLLSKAYTKRAEFYDNLQSWDAMLYETVHENPYMDDEDSNDLITDIEDEVEEDKTSLLGYIDEYLKEKLTIDEYLLLSIELDPPAYFLERMKTPRSKVSSALLIEFFELPRTKGSVALISRMRKHIREVLQETRHHI